MSGGLVRYSFSVGGYSTSVVCPAEAGREGLRLHFFVYVLKNTVSHRHYIGSTADITRRLSEHNRGQTKSTRQNGTWVLEYTEQYPTKLEVMTRERQIKSYKGGNAFKKLIAGIVHR